MRATTLISPLMLISEIFTGRVSIHHDDHFSHDNPPLHRAEGDAHASASGSSH